MGSFYQFIMEAKTLSRICFHWYFPNLFFFHICYNLGKGSIKHHDQFIGLYIIVLTSHPETLSDQSHSRLFGLKTIP